MSRRILAFSAVGSAGIAVQLASIALLVEQGGVDYRIATAAGVLAALAHNFAWHRVWTWADRPVPTAALAPLFGRFVLLNGVVSLVGNVGLMRLLVGTAGLPLLPANALAIVLCGLVNYWLADRRVFPTGEAAATRGGTGPAAALL